MASSKLPSDADVAPAALEERVAGELLRRLDALGSPLTADPGIADQLTAQVHAILGRTFDRLGVPRSDRRTVASFDVGRTRAQQNVHPVDSLTAAELLFDVALDELAFDGHPPTEVARALNASIMDDVVPASVAYVNVLLERLAVAHSEERLGISRELHDRVAHGIAVGIQRVRLSRQSEGAASERIEEALRLLESALEETRSLALDLRHSVGDKHLDEAIEDYVADLGGRPTVEARSEGVTRMLATGIQEEAFIIVREAIHNARRHSAAEHIHVTSTWLADRLVVTIADDGIGFDRDAIRPGALGLITAQERAELIGAELAIETRPRRGTTVVLTVVRPGGRA